MGWSLGYDNNWHRDVGYGVPAVCDHPDCNEQIDRGLSYVCGSEPYGGEYGCGLYFCPNHLYYRNPRGSDRSVENCKRCLNYKSSYEAKPDVKEWLSHKLWDKSWQEWRKKHPEEVKEIKKQIKNLIK